MKIINKELLLQKTLQKVNTAKDIEFTSSPIIQDEKTPWQKYGSPFFGKEAETNYIAGVLINDLSGGGIGPGVASFSASTNMGIAIGWNWFDGIDAIITGLDQIINANQHHHSLKEKAKGVANIIAGVELFLFSWLPDGVRKAAHLSSATSLAGSAFAGAMAVDLFNIALDYHYRLKKITFEGWLEEKLLKLNFLDERIESLTLSPTEKDQLTAKRESLLKTIAVRCQYFCNSATSKEDFQIRKEFIFTQCEKHLIHSENKIYTNSNSNYYSRLKLFTKELNDVEFTTVKTLDTEIQHHLLKREEESRNRLLMKGFSFVGMACLAIAPFIACPPLALVGMIFTSAVTAYYLYQHSEEFLSGCKQLVSGCKQLFFSKEITIETTVPVSSDFLSEIPRQI